jgi:S-adenosylmethionine:tRNA ribosyltransferase-isomerase
MPGLAFELPDVLEARQTPEQRGLRRDGVRLMVASRSHPDRLDHVRFRHLPDHLSAGDLLVVNVSATLPAAVAAERPDGSRVRVHVATRVPRLDDTYRVVEIRSADGSRPARGAAGERLALPGGAALQLLAPYASGARLMLARFEPDPGSPADASLTDYLAERGEPIRYGYVSEPRPLEDYQTVYATTPGSAEMPSAGRPFTAELILELVARGISLAPLTLHTGVSSPERHEPPFPEQYEVPEASARAVESTRAAGGRVIAVGTTVVRALETVAADDGRIYPGAGWTNVVITPERGVRAIDGLITGWHEPEASHLQMLEALAGRDLLQRSYAAALERGYLWHEFGDSHLILP